MHVARPCLLRPCRRPAHPYPRSQGLWSLHMHRRALLRQASTASGLAQVKNSRTLLAHLGRFGEMGALFNIDNSARFVLQFPSDATAALASERSAPCQLW